MEEEPVMVACAWADVEHLARETKKLRMKVSDARGAKWFCVRLPGREAFGCAAYLPLTGGRARVKSVFIREGARYAGLGTGLTELVMAAAEAGGYPILEALALNPKFYTARGFTVVSERDGIAHVQRLPEWLQ